MPWGCCQQWRQADPDSSAVPGARSAGPPAASIPGGSCSNLPTRATGTKRNWPTKFGKPSMLCLAAGTIAQPACAYDDLGPQERILTGHGGLVTCVAW